MKAKSAGAVAIACGLAFATLLVASVASNSFVHWLYTLPAGSVRLLQALASVVTTLLLGLGVYLRRRADSRGEGEP